MNRLRNDLCCAFPERSLYFKSLLPGKQSATVNIIFRNTIVSHALCDNRNGQLTQCVWNTAMQEHVTCEMWDSEGEWVINWPVYSREDVFWWETKGFFILVLSFPVKFKTASWYFNFLRLTNSLKPWILPELVILHYLKCLMTPCTSEDVVYY